ncbi:MAG TPA: flagellar biosynthetic protein FliO [Thermoguttaceae bacterium]|nr:flagellar biosynthetic protein FliO [Thermoguttaceae bacterium]
MCFWIWGGALLAGVFCQAAEGIWPRQSGLSGGDPRRLSAAVREAETSGFLPTTTDTSSNRQALQDESSTRRPVPSEHLQGNSASSIVSGSAERSESASGPAGGDADRPVRPTEEKSVSTGSASGRPEPIRFGPTAKSPPLSGVSGRTFDPAASTLTVLSSLAVVLGVFLLLIWAIRRAMPRSAQILPTEVVEILGRAPLMGKQQMYLLRCGPKLLLVSVTPEGAETLTEIEHPDEVARITALCRQGQPGSIPGAFRHILDQMAHPKPAQRWFRRSAEALEDSVAAEASLQEESARV